MSETCGTNSDAIVVSTVTKVSVVVCNLVGLRYGVYSSGFEYMTVSGMNACSLVHQYKIDFEGSTTQKSFRVSLELIDPQSR